MGRRLRKETLEKKAKGVLRFNRVLTPLLNVDCLISIESHSPEFPDINRNVLERLVWVGVLSDSSNGNYSAKYNDFDFNPVLKGVEDPTSARLYFVAESDCLEYADYTREQMGLPRRPIVTQEGKFEIPREIDANLWKVIRYKYVHRDNAEFIVGTLVERGVLNVRERSGYRVFLIKGGGVQEDLCPWPNSFRDRNVAVDYSRIFSHDKWEIRVNY